MITAQQLQKFSLFSAVSTSDLEKILPYLKERRYRKGQILFVEGEIGSSVFFVLSGQVKLSKMTPDGNEQIFDWCGPYDSFAEILLVEPGPYPATAEATQDCNMLVLDNDNMPSILEASPSLACALVKILGKRLRMAQEFIRILTSRSTAGILAALLLRLAQPGAPGEPIYVDGSFTHRDLASMIGTSREYVNRAINTWKRSGIINVKDNRIEILKPWDLADWP